ncbi:type 1 glutamine amidotransferase domain-containing protein [Loigolactobacillus bifermentans]|jgi:putative intracellular protease/amidase|uniref:Intracellular protease amidase n=1 Tax=Loigolactobacillus bifermentans DSM 20003 TaxID=1423726 RepID=A0A0R1GGY4_9LACO|nr:type 1 glutamine amidotransferase domain-containing protein [Loigolactobacillus bifermentans]KRK33145.1 intracellular protease amidase [Loigolactobacillus bifermentans DSM 20003]QGG60497.1 type 1 glutamine amidotransferase domain-containing protein [Loigolactobacillus bifermentans]
MIKVLIVETNVTRYGKTTDPTGLWLGEAAEFVADMQQVGIAVDYVSPKGGFVPLDPRSMKYTDETILKVYESADFVQRGLTQTLRPDQVDPADYAAIYYTGGHGVMWDFPDDPALQKIALTIYQNGGYVTSVCHGIAGLLNLKTETGQYLIAGKNITGFTTAEEILAGKKSVVPFLNRTVAEAHGAHFRKKRFYSEYAIQDGQLITGQNPFSVHAVAQRLIKQLTV